jgi:hypothetical protein
MKRCGDVVYPHHLYGDLIISIQPSIQVTCHLLQPYINPCKGIAVGFPQHVSSYFASQASSRTSTPQQSFSMYTIPPLLSLLAVHYVLALPNPAPWPATAAVLAAPPSQFTANPSIGGGKGSYKDSAHFRAYNISSTVDTTLKVMEAAHSCFVDTMGWRTPGLSYKDASNSGPWYKMNIYQVADGSMPGAAAQTWTDANAGLVTCTPSPTPWACFFSSCLLAYYI